MSYLNDFMNRLYEAPEDAQCGYRYSSTNLVALHVTSAIQTDEDAIAYIEKVQRWYPKTRVFLIEKRDVGQQNWRLIHRVEEVAGQLPVVQSESVLVQPAEVPEVSAPVIIKPLPVVIVPAIPRPAD